MANGKKYVDLKRKSRTNFDSTKPKDIENVKNLALKSYENIFKYFKIVIMSFVGLIIVLNILAPIVIYSWPNIMSHMIFQNFSKLSENLFN